MLDVKCLFKMGNVFGCESASSPAHCVTHLRASKVPESKSLRSLKLSVFVTFISTAVLLT